MSKILRFEDIDHFDDQADAVVLGYGIAGCCAALDARRAGGDVLVVERTSGGGGNCSLSSGIFYLGGGTDVQRAAGYEDTAENMYRFLLASMGSEQAALIRQFCDGSADHFAWLEAQGVPFERSYYSEKTVWTPNTEGLFSTGNEAVWPFRDIAVPVPRGHQVAVPGEASGIGAMKPLLARSQAEGVRASYDSTVTHLLVDDNGRVRGVRARQAGGDLHFRARRGVVVATGGFGTNREMLAEHFPNLPEAALPVGTPQTDGSGIQLAVAAGAATSAMNGMIATASIYPPSQLIKGIIVNRDGRRFVAEDSYHGRTGTFIAEQPGFRAYLIVDSEIFAHPELQFFHHRLVDGFETIEEMEARLEMPPKSLLETISAYNRNAARGVDPMFYKHPDWLKPLDKGPWAAFDISFDRSTYLYITLGGLMVDTAARVLTKDQRPIPGLYAAGASTVHLSRHGKAYASGISLGTGSFFGRVAGRNVMLCDASGVT